MDYWRDRWRKYLSKVEKGVEVTRDRVTLLGQKVESISEVWRKREEKVQKAVQERENWSWAEVMSGVLGSILILIFYQRLRSDSVANQSTVIKKFFDDTQIIRSTCRRQGKIATTKRWYA
jgi:hypothetical protein